MILIISCSVRPDSKLLLNVMKEIVHEEDFQERLDSVRERVDEIEVSMSSLHFCSMPLTAVVATLLLSRCTGLES